MQRENNTIKIVRESSIQNFSIFFVKKVQRISNGIFKYFNVLFIQLKTGQATTVFLTEKFSAKWL